MEASTKLSLVAIADLPGAEEAELVLSKIVKQSFDPDVLCRELDVLLAQAEQSLASRGHHDLRACQLEISIRLSSDEAGVRPALHLSRDVIEKLASVGAALDFDPYCG